ncbi:hypothetical protein [Malikia spinosa]|uniref:Uncharacterized protein n=1 Tax=Malikia spinosa TaxID=86180 RepID=A0A7C9N1Z2_9BURK|nr:hypothetical protein [Malikia spinosa]MYZ51580.1 hypothetical protein [Malikia spinosa]
MATAIHVFSETLLNGEWTADKADTYVQELPNRFGWIDSHMEPVTCPRQAWLYGLLVDEVRYSWPWSFHEKGLPEDASPQVKQISKSWGIDGYAHSHLTLQELYAKSLELLIDPREEAKELQDYLRQLITAIPVTSNSLDEHRIVFWFDS